LIYSSTRYIRHEYGGEIYSRLVNEKTYYFATTPRPGEPHQSSPIGSAYVPSGGTFVAYIHTHPNGLVFSVQDKQIADSFKVNAYVATPNNELLRYNHNSGTDPFSLGAITPRTLTAAEKQQLEKDFRASWDAHFDSDGKCPNNHGCENMDWPTR